MGIFDELIGELIVGALTVIGGAIVAVASYFLICTIVEMVEELITKWNIGGILKKALRNAKEQKAKKMLQGAVKAVVAGKTPDCVSVDVFNEDTEEKVRVKLKTTKGVHDTITEGMMISVAY